MPKQNLSVPIAIVIAGIIIAGAFFYNKDDGAGTNPKNGDANQKEELRDPSPVTEDDHILGNPDAAIALIEFSDTECPFCKRFHVTMRQVMDDYGKQGKVRWIYRHFPLDAIHPKARKEAEATECASELGGNEKFWQYLDRIYEITPSNNGLDLNELPKIAEYAGLDKNKFEECLESGRNAQKVQDDYQDGVNSGAQGTPYTMIIAKDGEKFPINGALPYMETSPGLYYSAQMSEEEKKILCLEETKLCGIKTAIDYFLTK